MNIVICDVRTKKVQDRDVFFGEEGEGIIYRVIEQSLFVYGASIFR